MLPDILRLDTVIRAEKPIPEEIDHRDDTGANSFQREIVDRAQAARHSAGLTPLTTTGEHLHAPVCAGVEEARP